MYTILRCNGRHEAIDQVPTFEAMEQAISCTAFDAVPIGKANRPPDDEILLVDDTGLLDGKPINPEATLLYWRVAPSQRHCIHGDAILTRDRYFGGPNTLTPEEATLRQVLGQEEGGYLPNALAIAAKNMGLSVEELNQMLGDIVARRAGV